MLTPETPATPLLAIRDPDARPHATLDAQARLGLLRDWLAAQDRVVVAYSGGVDSSLVLRVAHDLLGARALGVIGVSDSYASRELQLALEQAARFGARIETVTTGELADPVFASNPTDRCYHCKRELYAQLARVAEREGGAIVLDGTIADDLADWRPGRRAAAEHRVHSPLAELGFRKLDVRAAAEALGLTSAAKPASPCLASRIPYGTTITRAALSQVEQAEGLLRDLGFAELRVRHHGETARIEVPVADLPRLLVPGMRERAVQGIQALGFRWVAVDLAGLKSGGLNPPELLTASGATATSATTATATSAERESIVSARLGESTHISGTVAPSAGNNQCAPTEAAAPPAILAGIASAPGPHKARPSAGDLERGGHSSEFVGVSSDRFRGGSRTGAGK